MASRFGSHIRFWFFLGPLLAMSIMPVIPNKNLFSITDAESDSVETLLGTNRAQQAVTDTDVKFKAWFVESGIVRRTLEGSEQRSAYHQTFERLAGHWMVNFWHMVYRMVYRAMVMKAWWFGTLVLALAAFVDGSVRRKIKAATGAASTPLSFHVAAHGLLMAFGILLTALIVPVPIVAVFWAAVSGVVIALMWRIAASYQ